MSGPGKTSKIILVRHGECKANVADMNLSPEVDLITDKGLLQASLVGKTLENETFTRAYSSSYSRAQETATELMKQLKTTPPQLIVDERIREREMGEFENRPMLHLFQELFKDVKENGTKLVDFEVRGGESVRSMEERLESFLEDIIRIINESDEPQNILVVSHGVAVIRMIFRLRLWSRDPSKRVNLTSFVREPLAIPMKNAAYHVLTVTSPEDTDGVTTIDLTQLHVTKHLDSLKPKVPVPPTKDFQYILENWLEITEQQCATM